VIHLTKAATNVLDHTPSLQLWYDQRLFHPSSQTLSYTSPRCECIIVVGDM